MSKESLSSFSSEVHLGISSFMVLVGIQIRSILMETMHGVRLNCRYALSWEPATHVRLGTAVDTLTGASHRGKVGVAT